MAAILFRPQWINHNHAYIMEQVGPRARLSCADALGRALQILAFHAYINIMHLLMSYMAPRPGPPFTNMV